MTLESLLIPALGILTLRVLRGEEPRMAWQRRRIDRDAPSPREQDRHGYRSIR